MTRHHHLCLGGGSVLVRIGGDSIVGGGPKLVLVVEDEAFLRAMVVDSIEDGGYATIEAEDAATALDLLDHHEDIAAVFTDIRLPGTMDGVALAERLHVDHPGLIVILTSGQLLNRSDDLPAWASFLQKPYRPAALLAELDRLLN